MASYFTQGPAGGATVAMRRGRRRWLIALIALGVVLFLAISAELARFFSVENVEREDLVALLQAEARGSAPGMLAQLSGCGQNPACVATVRANAAKLHRPGSIKILTLSSPTSGSLTAATGTTRVAWTVIGTLPVVQCVRVRRTGNAVTGISLKLLTIGPKIESEGDC
ncbi:MAG: hypothetical protein ACHQDY_02865 [Solirubrobacterales bacterium]